MRGLHVSRVENARIEVSGRTAAVPCKASDADSVDLAKLMPSQTNATKSAASYTPASTRARSGFKQMTVGTPAANVRTNQVTAGGVSVTK